MTSFAVDFKFGHGFCILTLRIGTASIQLQGHWINDRLPDLLRCVNSLLEGTESVCCRWQGPIQEGHFIDLVQDPEKGVNIAISEFRYPDGATAAEIWSAERGAVRFRANLPLNDFAIAFAVALRRVRSTAVGTTGLLTEYPRPFPQSVFEVIEQKAARLGYKPNADVDV